MQGFPEGLYLQERKFDNMERKYQNYFLSIIFFNEFFYLLIKVGQVKCYESTIFVLLNHPLFFLRTFRCQVYIVQVAIFQIISYSTEDLAY